MSGSLIFLDLRRVLGGTPLDWLFNKGSCRSGNILKPGPTTKIMCAGGQDIGASCSNTHAWGKANRASGETIEAGLRIQAEGGLNPANGPQYNEFVYENNEDAIEASFGDASGGFRVGLGSWDWENPFYDQ